jgi:hypothetical protein
MPQATRQKLRNRKSAQQHRLKLARQRRFLDHIVGTYDDLLGDFAHIVGEQLELAGASHVQETIVEECQQKIEAVDISA